jgi:hypothetical protein
MPVNYNNQGANEARAAARIARIAPHRDSIIADLNSDELSVERIGQKYGLNRDAVISVGDDIGMDLRERSHRVQRHAAATRFAVDESAVLDDLKGNKLTRDSICKRHHITPGRLTRIAEQHDINMRERGKNLEPPPAYIPGSWVIGDTLCGWVSINALRLPLNKIAEALETEL